MNPLAAHKDELKKLLENLSGDTAVSGIGLVASLDAYIARASIRIAQTSRHASIRHQRKQTENYMEPTLTQNGALYYAQHKTSQGRAALLKKFRAAARKRRPDVRRQLTYGDLFIVLRLHRDNGC